MPGRLLEVLRAAFLRTTLCPLFQRLTCLLSIQRQRLINSANGVSSKPLQNGRHDNIENGNVPVENPEDPPREQEQQPPPLPPPPEPEPVEVAFLSPFSVPGEFWEGEQVFGTQMWAGRARVVIGSLAFFAAGGQIGGKC